MPIRITLELEIHGGEYHESTDHKTLKQAMVSNTMDAVYDQIHFESIENFKVVVDNEEKGHISISDGNNIPTHHDGVPTDDDGNAIPYEHMTPKQKQQVARVNKSLQVVRDYKALQKMDLLDAYRKANSRWARDNKILEDRWRAARAERNSAQARIFRMQNDEDNRKDDIVATVKSTLLENGIAADLVDGIIEHIESEM